MRKQMVLVPAAALAIATGASNASPAPPTGSFRTERRVEVAQMTTLSLRRHLVASGRTESPGSPASCVTDVQVRVLRRSRVRGGWTRVATTTTGVEGSFRVRLPDRPGRYVAVAKPSDVEVSEGCETSRSNVARHRHG